MSRRGKSPRSRIIVAIDGTTVIDGALRNVSPPPPPLRALDAAVGPDVLDDARLLDHIPRRGLCETLRRRMLHTTALRMAPASGCVEQLAALGVAQLRRGKEHIGSGGLRPSTEHPMPSVPPPPPFAVDPNRGVRRWLGNDLGTSRWGRKVDRLERVVGLGATRGEVHGRTATAPKPQRGDTHPHECARHAA